MSKPNDLLTVWMAAQEKGVHPKSVYRAIYGGRLVSEKVGKTVMVRRRELTRWEPRGKNEPK
jgi:hypothetical protein